MPRPDPRLYQIAILSSLLAYGMVVLDFEIAPARAVVLIGMSLLTQWACTRLWRLPAFDARSALISGLSLCLLLRTNFVWWRCWQPSSRSPASSSSESTASTSSIPPTSASSP